MQASIEIDQNGHKYHQPIWITFISKHDKRDAGVTRQGYYWAFCHPGCLPDSDFFGPYRSEKAAYKAAVEFIQEY